MGLHYDSRPQLSRLGWAIGGYEGGAPPHRRAYSSIIVTSLVKDQFFEFFKTSFSNSKNV